MNSGPPTCTPIDSPIYGGKKKSGSQIKLEVLSASDQKGSTTCSKSHSKLRTEPGWNSGPGIPSPKCVLVCLLVCILRGRGWGEGGRQPGPGGQGRFQQLLQAREGLDSGLQVRGSRGMAKRASREKECQQSSVGGDNLLFFRHCSKPPT